MRFREEGLISKFGAYMNSKADVAGHCHASTDNSRVPLGLKRLVSIFLIVTSGMVLGALCMVLERMAGDPEKSRKIDKVGLRHCSCCKCRKQKVPPR